MKLSVSVAGRVFDVEVAHHGDGLSVKVDGSSFRAKAEPSAGGYRVRIGAREHQVMVEASQVIVDDHPLAVTVRGLFGDLGGGGKGPGAEGSPAPVTRAGGIYPPMPGRVISLAVQVGDFVRAGSPLLVLEAMKMQNEIPSPREGRVKEIHVSPGQSVGPRDLLVVLE